ncbi:MAG: twin-arginine translocase TatA/TatE family subunit [Muribaculaceae bacterium]|nr:twin-arginine translocase TatA/TatE family subunit [Muribaculaceae bacterium]
MIGTTELVLIAGLALLLFGGKKLPELMKGMGQGVRSFKEGMNAPTEQPQPEEGEAPAEPSEDREAELSDEPKGDGQQ